MSDTDGTRVQVHAVADGAALAGAAAGVLHEAARAAVAARGRFVLALAGGTTPRALYARLAGTDGGAGVALPWDRTVLAFGDERCVAPDHPASNFGMVRATLLDHLPVAPAAVLRIPGELGADAAAAAYERTLRDTLRDTLRATLDAPDDATFDVALLGVGADGHTASLFPGDPLLDDVGDRWVAPVPVPPPDAPHARVTLTLACLRRARGVLVLVEGARKAPVVAAVRAAGDQVPHDALPAVRVRGRAWTRWLVDRAAAGEADVG